MTDEACREAFEKEYPREESGGSVALRPAQRAFAWSVWQAAYEAAWTACAEGGEAEKPVAWRFSYKPDDHWNYCDASDTRIIRRFREREYWSQPLYAHRSPSDREAALEEAAKVCDSFVAKDDEFTGADLWSQCAERIAFRIRALMVRP